MKFELPFILTATMGRVLSKPHTQFKDYSVDNRSDKTKEGLFIPLVGETHDAHAFVEAAIKAGATGVIFHKWYPQWEPYKDRVTFIEVQDTLVALKDLARAWRMKLQATVIGLSGSNGKTTTKDFLAQILSKIGRTHASRGSFNNHWGVPFTLLDTPLDADFCVLEMGMNHAGELTELTQIGQPHIVGLINVGRAHVGQFVDGIEGVARAKEEIYQAAPVSSLFVFNLDNSWTRKMYSKYSHHQTITYSMKEFSADVYLRIKEKNHTGFCIEGQVGGVLGQAQINFWGEHNLENLGMALALAYAAGVSPQKLWDQVESCHTGWGRNQWIETESGARVLFDAYNANPESFQQLFVNLEKTWDKNKNYFGIFSEMLELGDQASREHRSLGERASQLPWQNCLFIGPSGLDFEAGWKAGGNKNNPMILRSYEESLALDLLSMLDPNSQVIVKGSRGGALERIVERLLPKDFNSKK